MTRLKWLAHALAQSPVITSLMGQTENLRSGQVVPIIKAELVVLHSKLLFQCALHEFHTNNCCCEAEPKLCVDGKRRSMHLFFTKLLLPGRCQHQQTHR